MRDGGVTDDLLKEGAALSAGEAEELEGRVAAQPDDLDSRARLIGYYRARRAGVKPNILDAARLIRRGRQGPDVDAQMRHVLWVAANAPRAPLAGHRAAHVGRFHVAYAEAAAIWRGHADAEPPDATLLAHAIAFFRYENDFLVEGLLARAERAFPDDPRWARFRRAIRAQDLERAERMRGVPRHRPVEAEPDGAGSVSSERDGAERAAPDLDEMEALLRQAPDEEWSMLLRASAAALAFDLGRVDAARGHAEAMLALASAADTEREMVGDAVHHGHLMLGRIALAGGDVERAKAHLALAGRPGGRGLIQIFGPSMRLAKDLLARGERDVVLRFLALCRAFWPKPDIDAWSAEIRGGGTPDFGNNLRR
jgi:hypothetical protein